MGFLVDSWRRIGARLYLALGVAVLLTLVSSAVGVYYFERSGDLNYRVQLESVPVLEASWSAAREAERLQAVGLGMLADPDAGIADLRTGSVDESLGRLEAALVGASRAAELEAETGAVQDAAYVLAGVIDGLGVNREAALAANVTAHDLRNRLNSLSVDAGSIAAVSALQRMLLADDRAALDALWNEFEAASSAGVSPAVVALGTADDGVFAVRGQQLAIQARNAELAGDFDAANLALDGAMAGLLDGARAASAGSLESSLASFDQGRILLAAISIASVVVAILTAWLWVGNGVVRRISRLSERMRGMAGGDLETPVPEVSRDEIGELAGALEVFRQQALEVQRLNLVEQLYEELQVANDELQRMQDRLVAQEKLAALGELVSGVAHEISNPLNFVKNFCEASQELYTELAETLESYRTDMSDDDAALVDEISQELNSSLGRVHANGGRALAIVERMRGLGVVGGEPAAAELNPALRQAVQAGCSAFEAEWGDFSVEPEFDLDEQAGEALLVEADFGEAMVNLVLNACYAMRLKREDLGDGYEPQLQVTTRRVNNMVEVKMRDNGTGITDDVVGHIFNPFFSTRDGASGAGLGLPIAADVARRVGGDLVVDTVAGEYAEFTFTAPVATAVAAPAGAGD